LLQPLLPTCSLFSGMPVACVLPQVNEKDAEVLSYCTDVRCF